MAKRVLITLGFPPAPGGMQDYLYQRCTAPGESDILVIAPESPGWQQFDATRPVTVYRWHPALAGIVGLRRLEQVVKPLAIALAIHRRERIGVIECGQALPFGLIGLLFQRAWCVPYLIWAHGREILMPGRSRLWRPVLRLVLRQADAVVANSRWTRDRAVAAGARPERAAVVHPGVNRERRERSTHGQTHAHLEALSGRPIVLTVARLVRRKGVDTVLRALPAVIQVVPDCAYVVAGDGPDRPRLERLAAQVGVSQHVVFAGRVSDAMLAECYAACHVFVMVSRMLPELGEVEGFGIVYLEAGLHGKPVIAGREGGAGEAVVEGVTGLLVRPGSVVETAAAIIRLLLDHDLARRLGENGRRQADQPTDWGVLSRLPRVQDGEEG